MVLLLEFLLMIRLQKPPTFYLLASRPSSSSRRQSSIPRNQTTRVGAVAAVVVAAAAAVVAAAVAGTPNVVAAETAGTVRSSTITRGVAVVMSGAGTGTSAAVGRTSGTTRTLCAKKRGPLPGTTPSKRLGHRRHLERRDGHRTRSTQWASASSATRSGASEIGRSQVSRLGRSKATGFGSSVWMLGTNAGTALGVPPALTKDTGIRGLWMWTTAPGMDVALCSVDVKRGLTTPNAGMDIALKATAVVWTGEPAVGRTRTATEWTGRTAAWQTGVSRTCWALRGEGRSGAATNRLAARFWPSRD